MHKFTLCLKNKFIAAESRESAQNENEKKIKDTKFVACNSITVEGFIDIATRRLNQNTLSMVNTYELLTAVIGRREEQKKIHL